MGDTKMHYENLSTQQKERYRRQKEEYKASFQNPKNQNGQGNSGQGQQQGNMVQYGSSNQVVVQEAHQSPGNMPSDSSLSQMTMVKEETFVSGPGGPGSMPELQGRHEGPFQSDIKSEIREVRVPPGAQIIEVEGRHHIAISEANGTIRAGPQIIPNDGSMHQGGEEQAHSEASGSFVPVVKDEQMQNMQQ